jgi:hypothetical protein
MAEKAIADAHDAGLQFLRVAVTGYWPDILAPWQRDSPGYWAGLDRMFDYLDRPQDRLVPTFLWLIGQFADLGHDCSKPLSARQAPPAANC